MNALTPIRRLGLPAVMSEPRLSGDLLHAIDLVISPIPDVVASPFTIQQRREASNHLPEYNHLCRPTQPDVVLAWLGPIQASVRNTPTPNDFQIKAVAIAMACGNLPEAVFTAESQRLAMATFTFFPSGADVVKLLEPETKRLNMRRNALRTIVEQQLSDASPVDRPKTDAGREAVLAAFRPKFDEAMAAARLSQVDVSGKPSVTSHHLSKNQLADAYRQVARADHRHANACQTRVRLLLANDDDGRGR